jgi:hypothetical protein
MISFHVAYKNLYTCTTTPYVQNPTHVVSQACHLSLRFTQSSLHSQELIGESMPRPCVSEGRNGRQSCAEGDQKGGIELGKVGLV